MGLKIISSWGYDGNDFSALAGNIPVLTPQWGVITYTPGFASVIEELGMIISTRARPLG